MDQILHLLEYLGITPKQLVPSLLVGSLFLAIVYKWLVKDLKQTVGVLTDEARDLHNAAKEMQLHLAGSGDFSAQHSLKQKPLFELYGRHASPMRPNTKGEALLQNSGFYEAYNKLQSELFARMDNMHLRTPYDYESAASKTLFQLANRPEMDVVKGYVVNHPDEQLELLFGVASWVIRDDYEKYKKQQPPD